MTASSPALAPLIDIEALLQPLPAAAGTAPAEAQDAALTAIDEARREDDPALPRGIWERTLKKADWKDVVALSTDYLKNRGKSLKVANHLLDALAHLHGVAGLAPGFELLAGLCERFWDSLLPPSDEEPGGVFDHTARINLLLSLDKRVPMLLARLPLGQPAGGGAPVTWGDYQSALFTDRALRRQGSAPAVDAMAMFAAAIADTPTAPLQGTHQRLAAAEQGLARLQSVLLLVIPDDKPSLAACADALAEIRNWVEVVLRERGVVFETEPDDEADWADEDAEDEAGHRPVARDSHRRTYPFSSREEAYAVLGMVADYLAATEPHSPTPYLLRRAVAWGTMPLHELLAELSQDRTDLSSMFALMGVTPQKR